MLEVDLDWSDKTGQKPPSPLFKGEVRLDEKKENKERQVAETMLKAIMPNQVREEAKGFRGFLAAVRTGTFVRPREGATLLWGIVAPKL